MKKMKAFTCAFIFFLISNPVVHAACSTEEANKLNSIAVNVKTSYEVVKEEIPYQDGFTPPDGLTDEEIANYKYYQDVFKIHIENITEELYITVTNKKTDKTQKYTYADAKDGTVTISEIVSDEIVDYVITVYSSDKTGCANTELNTINYSTPMFNYFSTYSRCEGIEEFYLCHPYLSVSDSTTYNDFVTMAEKYRSGKINEKGEDIPEKDKKKQGFLNFIKEHKGVVIGSSIAVLTIGGLVIGIIIKKQRSRVV